LLLRGDAHVDATVHGLHLRAHVQSFFQANRFLVDALLQEVPARPPAGRRAGEVRGFELSPTAVEGARANAEAAGLSQVRIHSGDVREMAQLPPRPDERIL